MVAFRAMGVARAAIGTQTGLICFGNGVYVQKEQSMGKLIYFVSYGIAVVAMFIAKHAACGIDAAHRRAESPPSVAHAEEDVTERLLLDLEKVVLEMISAARANDLPRLHERGRAQMAILSTIEQESTWSKE